MIRWSCAGRDAGVQKSRKVNKNNMGMRQLGVLFRLTNFKVMTRTSGLIRTLLLVIILVHVTFNNFVLVQSNAGKMLSESQPKSTAPAHNWRVLYHSSRKAFWDLQSKSVIQHNPIQLHMQINLKKYLQIQLKE